MFRLRNASWSRRWLTIPPLLPLLPLGVGLLADSLGVSAGPHSTWGAVVILGFAGSLLVAGILGVLAIAASTVATVASLENRNVRNVLAAVFCGASLVAWAWFFLRQP
jgi:hypothetical protein